MAQKLQECCNKLWTKPNFLNSGITALWVSILKDLYNIMRRLITELPMVAHIYQFTMMTPTETNFNHHYDHNKQYHIYYTFISIHAYSFYKQFALLIRHIHSVPYILIHFLMCTEWHMFSIL